MNEYGDQHLEILVNIFGREAFLKIPKFIGWFFRIRQWISRWSMEYFPSRKLNQHVQCCLHHAPNDVICSNFQLSPRGETRVFLHEKLELSINLWFGLIEDTFDKLSESLVFFLRGKREHITLLVDVALIVDVNEFFFFTWVWLLLDHGWVIFLPLFHHEIGPVLVELPFSGLKFFLSKGDLWGFFWISLVIHFY